MFSNGKELTMKRVIGVGVKNCPSDCFTPSSKKPSNKVPKNGLSASVFSLISCNISTTSFKIIAFWKNNCLLWTSRKPKSLLL